MLRITASKSVDAALHYFDDALSKGDYYLEGLEVSGDFGGIAAKKLKLSGAAEKEVFNALLSNRLPDGARLTTRDAPNRRPGYDLTFDVPKSVSILHALTGNEKIVAAMEKAVMETMYELEAEMHCRVRKNGAFEDRKTGNMLWVPFTHFTTRPAEGSDDLDKGVPDPHLHMHVYALNATHDRIENIWKAGEFSRIKRDASYYQSAYHVRLAAELQKLGLDIVPTKDAFEIAGIQRSLISKFSRRTDSINELAKLLGINDASHKSELGAKSRAGKRKDLSLSQLRHIWKEALSFKEMRAIEKVLLYARRRGKVAPVIDASVISDSLNAALNHELARASEISERRLLATALRYAVGNTSTVAMLEVLKGKSGLLRAMILGEKRISTREILNEEKSLLNYIR